jgi:hypothetical protein
MQIFDLGVAVKRHYSNSVMDKEKQQGVLGPTPSPASWGPAPTAPPCTCARSHSTGRTPEYPRLLSTLPLAAETCASLPPPSRSRAQREAFAFAWERSAPIGVRPPAQCRWALVVALRRASHGAVPHCIGWQVNLFLGNYTTAMETPLWDLEDDRSAPFTSPTGGVRSRCAACEPGAQVLASNGPLVRPAAAAGRA